MSSYYTSRTNPNIDVNDESYSTIDLYLGTGSPNSVIPLPGYTNINAGFTCILANPIILDIGHRYVMALTKGEYDLTNYTDRFYSMSIYCDQLEYQYDYGQKTQLLYQVYGNAFITGSDNIQLGLWDVVNVAWKFINPTTKIISRISFWVLDDTGQPLRDSPLPNLYSTNFNILIKKVNSHVVAVSAL